MDISGINSQYNPKPIPDRSWDWEAWQSANYDLGSPTGYGPTENDAVSDLLQQLEDSCDARQ